MHNKKLKSICLECLSIQKDNPNRSMNSISKEVGEKYNYCNRTLRRAINKHKKNFDHQELTKKSEEMGFPLQNVSSYWLKNKHISIHVKGDDANNVDYLKAIGEIVDKYCTVPLKKIEKTKSNSTKAIKATLSDMHVGLEPNPNNKAIFSYEYNETIFKQNLEKVFNSILKEYDANGKFDILIIDDLGDGLDGWDGLTTRGGHKLDQNMSNEQMFKVFVEGKLSLIENCINAKIADKVIVRNVAADNHSGSFASIANMAIEMILKKVYHKDDLNFYILTKFIEHFVYGDHTFILTHGKDPKYMFKGLPYELNDKAISFINDYIDHFNINTRFIHLEKGDLHRVGYSRTKKFDYRNFMSFAPPSSWVQHNFGDCYSGYSIQIINKYSGEISHTDYYFDLKKVS
jgi:hypothetical protein